MAAGVSALQYAQLPNSQKLMHIPKVGTDFLASSHFTVAQEKEDNQRAIQSIFKQDYPPWPCTSKPSSAVPPKPAHLMQKDARFFNEKASETVYAYEYRSMAKPQLIDDPAVLRATNFKMDKDLSKFDSFHTTHNLDYQPKEKNHYLQGQTIPENAMQSFIPQGDVEKAPQPVSDYRDRYRGQDALRDKPKRASSMHQGGPPTILGDSRQHHFNTTHNDVFPGVSLPRLTPYPAPTGTNIPQGDKEKELAMKTIQQESFPTHTSGFLKPYNKESVMGKLGRTNYKEQDGHGVWDTYMSTAADSYPAKRVEVVRSAPANHRNHSDFPDGDQDPNRVGERVNMTTYRFYNDDPPRMPKPKIESGADKRTKSNVWFGEPRLGDTFYSTTVDSTFRPTTVPYNYKRYDNNTRSCVPVDYYANEKGSPTTWSDFQNPQLRKMIPNPRSINNLKRSHIMPPLGGTRVFSTEHLDQYTPKASRRDEIDAGRLQKSTVPLGTMKI